MKKKHTSLLDSDIAELDTCIFAMDVVLKGQIELGLDCYDMAEYMQKRGFKNSCINTCFNAYWRTNDLKIAI